MAEDLRILRNETRTNETNIKVSGVARRLRWKQLMKQLMKQFAWMSGILKDMPTEPRTIFRAGEK